MNATSILVGAYNAMSQKLQAEGYDLAEYSRIFTARIKVEVARLEKEGEALTEGEYCAIAIVQVGQAAEAVKLIGEIEAQIEAKRVKLHSCQKDLYPRHASSSFYNYQSELAMGRLNGEIKEMQKRIEYLQEGGF